ncbi:alpha/beta hydrolase [Verrucomicrobiota bacterium]
MPKQTEAAWFDSPDVLAVTFHPRREWDTGDAQGFEILDIPVADGVTVGARFYAAGPEKPTILFFHGNGEIVADYEDIAALYVRMGVNFAPVDYRGYGRSSGRPTISSMLADARTVFKYMREWLAAKGYEGPVIVMGRSLGSASALEIASAYPTETAGLIVDSGFADVIALLVRLGAGAPAGVSEDSLVRQEQKMALYRGPTLIIHGTHDMIIPVRDADALFKACPSAAKRLVKIEGAGHNNLMAAGLNEYMQAVTELVRSVDGGR